MKHKIVSSSAKCLSTPTLCPFTTCLCVALLSVFNKYCMCSLTLKKKTRYKYHSSILSNKSAVNHKERYSSEYIRLLLITEQFYGERAVSLTYLTINKNIYMQEFHVYC